MKHQIDFLSIRFWSIKVKSGTSRNACLQLANDDRMQSFNSPMSSLLIQKHAFPTEQSRRGGRGMVISRPVAAQLLSF
jgi:hypothetical protein